MATGINIDGKAVNVNDQVSIIAKVVSVSGSGSLATVTVQFPLAAGTNSVQANDAQAVFQPADATHVARGINGQPYGALRDDITVLGTVTAISGSGVTALLTVTLKSSGNSITGVPAGAVHSFATV